MSTGGPPTSFSRDLPGLAETDVGAPSRTTQPLDQEIIYRIIRLLDQDTSFRNRSAVING